MHVLSWACPHLHAVWGSLVPMPSLASTSTLCPFSSSPVGSKGLVGSLVLSSVIHTGLFLQYGVCSFPRHTSPLVFCFSLAFFFFFFFLRLQKLSCPLNQSSFLKPRYLSRCWFPVPELPWTRSVASVCCEDCIA